MPRSYHIEPADAVLRSLAEALDQVDIGILLLDRAMRVRYINRSLINMCDLPASLLASRPTFRDLLGLAASRSRYAMPATDLPDYIDQREAAVRAGSVAPTHIDLADGSRLLYACKACLDGGRILTYDDVSREVRPEALDAMEQINADLRYYTETIEDHAAQMASLAEATDESARKVEAAKQELEREVAERRLLEARLRQMATTDGLTGALNRAGFLALAQSELERDMAAGRSPALMMLDVDHFKSINDRFGHAGGDLALKHLVSLLGGQIRRSDLLGRLGGEEFAILLPAIAAEDAGRMAERLVAYVADTPVTFGERLIAMTVSIGLTMVTAADRSIEKIIARADDALYRAKDTGRNKVVRDLQMETEGSSPHFSDQPRDTVMRGRGPSIARSPQPRS